MFGRGRRRPLCKRVALLAVAAVAACLVLPHHHRQPAAPVTNLSSRDLRELEALCARCYWHTLTTSVTVHGLSDNVYVSTGDIDGMWLRDSSVQMGVYLPEAAHTPQLQLLLLGTLRTQAYMLLQDPYANAFRPRWREPDASSGTYDRGLGRGGWVFTRNYEPDSLAYFLHGLADFHDAHLDASASLAQEVFKLAARAAVATLRTEQRHEADSPYRYKELSRRGLGSETAYTGMTWGGFRPSDDPQAYGYNVPVNMHVCGALTRLARVAKAVWRDAGLAHEATQLAHAIAAGIEAHGVVTTEDGVDVYAYEVDGRGNSLYDFDDANVPSLLSAPMLGYPRLNLARYLRTRERLLSPRNPVYFAGSEIAGIGSPHTPAPHVWPLSLMVQALTSSSADERTQALRHLLKTQCGDGLMHESVHASSLATCTRPHFEWANAMLVRVVRDLFPGTLNCTSAANALWQERMGVDPLFQPVMTAYMKHASGGA